MKIIITPPHEEEIKLRTLECGNIFKTDTSFFIKTPQIESRSIMGIDLLTGEPRYFGHEFSCIPLNKAVLYPYPQKERS